MTFEFLPVVELMLEFYQKPKNIERFNEYLRLLEGDTKGGLSLPLSGFNPMAGEHVLQKLRKLKALHVEGIIAEVVRELNASQILPENKQNFKLAFNLSDDLKGLWTNRFTSDYDSKFRFHGLFNRGFCVPVFWSSESYSESIIRKRTLEYAYRTIYWLKHPKPETLKEHLEQELFVAGHFPKQKTENCDFTALEKFYLEHQNSEIYAEIFNFFYGDAAASVLGFPTFGLNDKLTGFDYAENSK